VSWRHLGFSYYTRLPAGREYAQLLRDLNSFDPPEPLDPASELVQTHGIARESELLLDANLLAEGSDYCELGLTEVSPDARLLAYSVDLVGDEVYRLHFRDLGSGQDLEDEIERTYYGGAWSAGSDQFFYTVHDAAYRSFQVW